MVSWTLESIPSPVIYPLVIVCFISYLALLNLIIQTPRPGINHGDKHPPSRKTSSTSKQLLRLRDQPLRSPRLWIGSPSSPLSRLLGSFEENAAVVDPAHIFLLHDAVFRPDEEIRRDPLERTRRPPKEIKHHPLLLPEDPHVARVQAALVPAVVFGEDVFELLGAEPALVVVGHAVAAVFGFVETVDVDAEEGVGEDGGACGVGETEVDEEGCDEREEDAPAVVTAANVGVVGPDYRVVIAVPVGDVLLDDLLERGMLVRLIMGFRPADVVVGIIYLTVWCWCLSA